MNIPSDTITYINENCPYYLYPAFSLVLGLFHLFPLCCIASFVLGEIGQSLQTFFPMQDWHQFQQWESDYYDDEKMLHLCRFHGTQTENMNAWGFTKPFRQVVLGEGCKIREPFTVSPDKPERRSNVGD